MSRLTVFAKGNSDVLEAVFGCRDATGAWGGLNEGLRARGSSARVRVRHETFVRSDVLRAAEGVVPPDISALQLRPPFDLTSQFSAALFDGSAAAHILSIQPDVTNGLARHRRSGTLFLPAAVESLPKEEQDWLRVECVREPLLTPDQSLENFAAIVGRLRRRSTAPILICNMSSMVPGERVDSYRGVGETLTTRIKRFNLALVELSARSDVIVVDVDRIAAQHGADRLKLDGSRLNCTGCRLVGEDVLRLLEENDCFAPRA